MTSLFLESTSNDEGEWLILLFIIGGLAQIIVGIVQLIGSIIRIISSIHTHQSIKNLCRYWIIVLLYFLVLAMLYYLEYDWFLFIPFAWIIAIWYSLVIVFNKKENEK